MTTKVTNPERSAILDPLSEDAQRERYLFDDHLTTRPANRVFPCDRSKDTLQSKAEDSAALKVMLMVLLIAAVFSIGLVIGHGWR